MIAEHASPCTSVPFAEQAELGTAFGRANARARVTAHFKDASARAAVDVQHCAVGGGVRHGCILSHALRHFHRCRESALLSRRRLFRLL
eukprot:2807892-Pleurochrysis_carterae.AAC.7